MYYAGDSPNFHLGNWILQSLSMCGTLQSRGKSDGSRVTMAELSDVASSLLISSTIMILVCGSRRTDGNKRPKYAHQRISVAQKFGQ